MDNALFNEKLTNDEAFAKKLTDASNADEILAVMKDAGFEVSAEELDAVLASIDTKEASGSVEELSEDDLDSIVGGVGINVSTKLVINGSSIDKLRKLLSSTFKGSSKTTTKNSNKNTGALIDNVVVKKDANTLLYSGGSQDNIFL